MAERTFSIIKPDAVADGHASAILTEIDKAGFRIVTLRKESITKREAEGFYAVVDLTAEPATVSELDRQLNLNEAVLRTKVTRPDHH